MVKDADGFAVTLGDVAKVEIGAEDDRRATRFNGKNSVTIGIVKQATANPLDVARAVRAALPELVENLPAGMDAVIANDTTVFIERSISAVFITIAEAVGLVVLVTLLFLRSFRATLIPVVTIPVSLIATFALMYAAGFSINTLTLLALVLAIGLVVDDAIVVLENVYRHIESGERAVRGGADRHARDRLRGHRHDAHAGRGLRADGADARAAPAGCSSSSRWRWLVRCSSRASSRSR